MTLAFLIALLALASLLGLYRLVRGRARALRNLQDLEAALEPVDIQAFLMLVDGDEREFLREELPAREFRRVQRLRARASLDYVGRIARNAALLLRLGELARQERDPDVARAGDELAALAMRVRLNALSASARLRLLQAFPGATQHFGQVLPHYRRLTDAAHQLARLRQQAAAGAAS